MAGKPPDVPSRWTVGKTAVAGVSLAALIGAGIYVTQTFCWSDCRTVKAGKIDLTPTSWAVGHYKMVEAGFNGIQTDNLGGACLAWKSPNNARCKVDHDCKVNLPANMIAGMEPDPLSPSGMSPKTKPEVAGAYGYCSPEKRCWVKMKFSDCQKSPPPLVLNQDNITKEASLLLVRAGLYGFGKGPAKIQGRVIACLNGKFTPGPGVTAPCGGGPGDVRHDWSNPQPIDVPMQPAPPLTPPGG